MVEPRGIEPLTFAMPLLENRASSLFFQAFLVRYQPERDKNIGPLRYRCDTKIWIAKVALPKLRRDKDQSKHRLRKVSQASSRSLIFVAKSFITKGLVITSMPGGR